MAGVQVARCRAGGQVTRGRWPGVQGRWPGAGGDGRAQVCEPGAGLPDGPQGDGPQAGAQAGGQVALVLYCVLWCSDAVLCCGAKS